MFEVGDVVQCWRECDGLIASAWEPKVGSFYTVAGVDVGIDDFIILDLHEDPNCFSIDGAWEAEAFRKILPADPAFIELMRGLKAPKRVKEDA